MKKSNLQIKQHTSWRKIYITIGLLSTAILIFSLLNGGIFENLEFLVLTFSIFLFFVIISLVFFSQFTLPVLNIFDRVKAASRLFSYIIGDHGPAMFIENGELRERRDERLKQGPGVILLDTASAALMRTPTQFKGAVGPGIAFTERNDSIAGVVDLHIQNKKVGPRLEENPFLPRQNNESEAAYETRQMRRNETQALTRDGIQICSSLSVVFKLDTSPGQGNSEFGYSPQAVERAVIGQTVDLEKPPDNPDRMTSWKWLPAYLAVDIWREYAAKITLNELFPLSKHETSFTEVINKHIRQRLTEHFYQTLDDYGYPTNQTQESAEFSLLKNRGIKVIAVNISHIFLPDFVEDYLVKRWKTGWLEFAQKEKIFVEEKHRLEQARGFDQAQMDYAYASTHFLGSVPISQTLSAQEIAADLIKGNLYLIEQDPTLHSLLTNEPELIVEILEWITANKDQP